MVDFELRMRDWLPAFDNYVKRKARSGHKVLAYTQAQMELAQKRAQRLRPNVHIKFELRPPLG